jgi:alkaline phosphatase
MPAHFYRRFERLPRSPVTWVARQRPRLSPALFLLVLAAALLAPVPGLAAQARNISDEEAKVLAGESYRKDATQSYIPTPRSLVSILQRHLGVGWATSGHTASPVFVFGAGPGSEAINGFRHNTELFRMMRGALGSSGVKVQ